MSKEVVNFNHGVLPINKGSPGSRVRGPKGPLGKWTVSTGEQERNTRASRETHGVGPETEKIHFFQGGDNIKPRDNITWGGTASI